MPSALCVSGPMKKNAAQAFEVAAAQAQHTRAVLGNERGVTQRAVEEREFADDVAGTQHTERDFVVRAGRLDDRDAATRDDVEVVVAAHGNSIRALVKHLDKISDDDIVGLEIPNGVPIVYELDAGFQPISRRFLEAD